MNERMLQEAMNGPLAEHIVMDAGDRIMQRGFFVRIIVAEYSEEEIVALNAITAESG
jgi:hypothetical protein